MIEQILIFLAGLVVGYIFFRKPRDTMRINRLEKRKASLVFSAGHFAIMHCEEGNVKMLSDGVFTNARSAIDSQW